MRTVAIVQARMGSTRFPGKTLEDLGGRTVLQRVLDRVGRASCVDRVVVATTHYPEDDAIVDAATAAGVPVFRGSSRDVLDRYIRVAHQHGAYVIVRNTGDEPFLDPLLIDQVYHAFIEAGADYASNNLTPLFPEGLDTEVISMEALERAAFEASRPSDREHVTPFIWRNTDRFRLAAPEVTPVHPEWRLTVDYPQDLEFARAVYAALGRDTFGLHDLVAVLEARPDLLALCPQVQRREGYLKSVSEE